MGYRIDYPTGKKEKKQNRYVAVFVGLVLLGILVNCFWPEGRRLLLNVLLPGDPAVTVSAMECMARELKTGASFADALWEFCQRMMAG